MIKQLLFRPVGLAAFGALVALGFPSLTFAWTPASQESLATMAARLLPPDLHRQIARNRQAFRIGVLEAFEKEPDPAAHEKNPDGSGRLDTELDARIHEAILAIESHRPFNDVVYRLGRVAHLVADANDPLRTHREDPQEARFGQDFHLYLQDVQGRADLVFYGFRAPPVSPLPQLLDEALARGRRLYPLVGREYRRIGFASGLHRFDDRSTAYAIATLAASHAVSDIAETLRYIWLAAGGTDSRERVPIRGRDSIRLPPVR